MFEKLLLLPKKNPVSFGFVLFFISSLIIACRNFSPYAFPTLYAEDGVWAGLILTQGFWDAALHARAEFPTLGLVALLDFSLIITKFLFSGDLTLLPKVIFFVSTAFVSLIAVLVVTLTLDNVSRLTKFALWVSVLLIPVGSDGNEIYGRILNLSWLFPLLQLILMVHILENHTVGRKFILATLIYCAIASLTFPICIAFNILAASFVLYKAYFLDKQNRTNYIFFVIGLMVIFIIGLAALGQTAFTSKGGADLPFAAKGLIEFAFARLLLFPYLFPIYSHLNNIVVLFLGVFAVAILSAATMYVFIRRPSARLPVGFVLVCFFTYFSSMIVLRSGFTSWYGDYNTTFPDRYFYGINIIFLMVILVVAEQIRLIQHRYSTLIHCTAASSVILILLLGSKGQFEFSTPKTSWGQLGSFEYSLCVHMSDLGPIRLDRTAPTVSLPIYPVIENYAWRMNVPLDDLSFLTAERCKIVFDDVRKRPF